LDIDTNAAPADRCTLTHRVFTSFGEPAVPEGWDQRAWQSLLIEWDVAGTGCDEGILLLPLNRSYQFLTPRYMPVTEWTALSRPAKRKQDKERRMLW
jgi:hypothetical protein